MTLQPKNPRFVLLTPAGAAIALISFFLPWIKISCMGTSIYSGYDFGGIFWTIFASAAAILAGFFILSYYRSLKLLRTLVSFCILCAFAVVFYACITMAGGKRILLVKIGPDDVNLRLHVGSYGTIFGFLLSFVGSLFSDKQIIEPDTKPTDKEKKPLEAKPDEVLSQG